MVYRIHMLDQHQHLIGITPLVVIPGNQLDKCIRQRDTSSPVSYTHLEYIGGSQEQFVEMMNQRAQELGMVNTHFVNPCGLDADGHVTTARDIAIMSRELMMNFPEVTAFTTTWHEMMPHVWRSGPGETDMTNTNHLIQSYNGMTGLKTGFTRLAKYSLSATATRNDMSLIAVIMGAETKDQRSADVTKLLDYGFGSFVLQTVETDGQSAGCLLYTSRCV